MRDEGILILIPHKRARVLVTSLWKDRKLEVVVLPVPDVDRATNFYSEQVRCHVDIDLGPELGNAERTSMKTTPPPAT